MKRALAFLAALYAGPGWGQTLPQTRAERTGYRETSTTADVVWFLDSLATAGVPIAVGTMGMSAGGIALPLVIASDPPVTAPAEAVRSGKVIVYLQANIHGGEVEGKEAVQMLLRDLGGARRALLSRVILLVAPVYNADGNDAWGPQAENRPSQNGPELVGRRPDGMNLDLNRDYLKAEAPETQASLREIYNKWDPALMVDLHTTDGTRHGFLLTYAPPLDPNGPAGPTQYVREKILPFVRNALQQKYNEPIFDYGNVDDPQKPTKWETYSQLAWYGTNYVGLRGRMAILSEAYTHAEFQTRVKVTYDFLVELLSYVWTNADEIRRVVADADRQTLQEGLGMVPRPPLGVAFEAVARGPEPIPLEVVEPPAVSPMPTTAAEGAGAEPPRPPPPSPAAGRMRTVNLPVFDRFTPTRTRTAPAGYLLPAGEGSVARLLRLHGVRVYQLTGGWKGTVEVYTLSRTVWAERPFQGHNQLSLSGEYQAVPRDVPARSFFIPTAQPLGRLVFELLEPEGYGLASWNFFDRWISAGEGPAARAREFPVTRVAEPPRTSMLLVP